MLYRFRSIQKLLEFKELENQEIYLSSPEELNDPAEGYFEIVWSGDEILWENFFSHYIRSLYCAILLGKLEIELTTEHIHYFRSLKELESLINDLFDVELEFFRHQNIIKLIEHFANCNVVSKYTLAIALLHITKPLTQLINRKIRNESNLIFSDDTIISFLQNHDEISDKNLYFSLTFNKEHGNENNDFIRNFSFIYIENINKMVFEPWYVACFMKRPSDRIFNPLMWAHYGDGHKGVCLEFDDEIIGSINGDHRNFKPKKVEYTNENIKLNFFENVAIYRYNMNDLKKAWYINRKGEVSKLFDVFKEKINDSLEEMIRIKTKILHKKLKLWETENEERIIVTDIWNEYKNPNSRKIKYEFNSLKSITFGEKVSKFDRLKIMQIIEEKCLKHDRKDFLYRQAYMDPITKEIKEILLIK